MKKIVCISIEINAYIIALNIFGTIFMPTQLV